MISGTKYEKACQRFAEKILPALQKVLIEEIEEDNLYPKKFDEIPYSVEEINKRPIHSKAFIRDGVIVIPKNHYTEKEMLDFAWFVVENVGKQFSCDRTAHFEGEFLNMFKKLKNGNDSISN